MGGLKQSSSPAMALERTLWATKQSSKAAWFSISWSCWIVSNHNNSGVSCVKKIRGVHNSLVKDWATQIWGQTLSILSDRQLNINIFLLPTLLNYLLHGMLSTHFYILPPKSNWSLLLSCGPAGLSVLARGDLVFYKQVSQNDSPFEISLDCVVIGDWFCHVKLAANDNTIGGNIKKGVILRALFIKLVHNGRFKGFCDHAIFDKIIFMKVLTLGHPV